MSAGADKGLTPPRPLAAAVPAMERSVARGRGGIRPPGERGPAQRPAWAVAAVGALVLATVPAAAGLFVPGPKLLPGDDPEGSFGSAVAISGGRLAVGTPDFPLATERGSVYVFERDAAGAWAQKQRLMAEGGLPEDLFGSAVALSGDHLVVGASFSVGTSQPGSAFLFGREVNGAWAQRQHLVAADGAADDLFGLSVAIDGDRLAIGAGGDDDRGLNAGSAYVFERNGTGAWVQEAKVLASDGAAFDRFGPVAIRGDRLLVGAPQDDTVFSNTGSVYVFERDAAGTWVQVQKLLAPDGQADDFFGSSVSLDGDRALVGAFLDDDQGSASGSAYVFEREGGAFVLRQKVLATDGAAGDRFGRTVAIEGDILATGALNDDDLGADSGSAYVFTRRADGTWLQDQKLHAFDGAARDAFGWAIALDGAHLVSTARGDGSAYPFCLDTTAPAAAVSRPAAGFAYLLDGEVALPSAALPVVAAGPLTVVVDAADDCAIAQVDFVSTTGASASDTRPPYTFVSDPGPAASGPVTVAATVRDGAGHATSVEVSFIQVGTAA